MMEVSIPLDTTKRWKLIIIYARQRNVNRGRRCWQNIEVASKRSGCSRTKSFDKLEDIRVATSFLYFVADRFISLSIGVD